MTKLSVVDDVVINCCVFSMSTMYKMVDGYRLPLMIVC